MIVQWAGYHNPVCDNCGHMLPAVARPSPRGGGMDAEAVAAAAEAAMQAAGWEKRGGRDICALCRRIERETGKLPVRVRYDLRRTAEKGRAEEGQA